MDGLKKDIPELSDSGDYSIAVDLGLDWKSQVPAEGVGRQNRS